MNLLTLLEMAVSGFGERVAVRSGGAALSYEALFAAAGRAAAEIRAAGVQHVALLDVNSPAVPIGLFASAWAGVPFVPLNYRLTGAELDALLERVVPAYLVTEAERVPGLARDGLHGVAREAFLARSGAGAAPESEWPMDPEAIALLLFTSGTTGAPKAAVLRHKHLLAYILESVEFGAADEEEATLVSVPPYHIAGMAAILSSVYTGRRLVQLSAFSAEAWLELARDERVTHAFVVPTMLARIVDAMESAGIDALPELRASSYGGGMMPERVIARAMQRLPQTDFTNAYGLTETSSTIALLGPDDHRSAVASDDPAVRRRLTSVGRALPGVEVEIRDLDGKPVPAGESGEIWVRGEQVAGEYLGAGTLLESDGWFRTRDGGALDAEGYLFVEGRIDDVIVRGGENLSPGEIEAVLREHDAVGDCAVIGVPDEQWGQAVAAVIVPRAGRSASEAELQDWVKSRMRSSRSPSRIEFWDELPYNETGKLLRRVVRARLGGTDR
jgi:acyl-CoA synthetase (AMP-forming)/AMP-acid ligase II